MGGPLVQYERILHGGGFRGLGFRLGRDKTKDVSIGIFADAGSYPQGPTVAQVAYWNTYGTDNIPPRDFFGVTLVKNREEYIRALGAIVQLVIRDAIGADRARRNLGERGRRDAQKEVVDFKVPPNSPVTIARKGFDDPLIETKKLLRSITYRIGV